jgi:hypothetical protein
VSELCFNPQCQCVALFRVLVCLCRPVFILDDVQVGLVPHTALFDRDFGAALTMLGDMSHDLLLVAMSSDRRFISALQRLPGVRDRLKVVGMNWRVSR